MTGINTYFFNIAAGIKHNFLSISYYRDNMKIIIIVTAMLTILANIATASPSLTTSFIDSNGKEIGTAVLKDIKNGTLITLDLQLPAGAHAIHMHENAKCEIPGFATAKGHFNPEKHKHGYASKEGFHAGDLPNLYVEPTGHIKAEIYTSSRVISAKNNIAIVIHEFADDYSSDPAGNSGNRIACAIVAF